MSSFTNQEMTFLREHAPREAMAVAILEMVLTGARHRLGAAETEDFRQRAAARIAATERRLREAVEAARGLLPREMAATAAAPPAVDPSKVSAREWLYYKAASLSAQFHAARTAEERDRLSAELLAVEREIAAFGTNQGAMQKGEVSGLPSLVCPVAM
jgi:hypothetical protein